MMIVYLNGEYMPLENAKVSIEDRGFLFADGVYEVARFYHGRPFRLEAHLERLCHSAHGAQLPLPDSVADLPHIIERVLAESDTSGDTEAYIQCTRGVSHPRGHPFPTVPNPTLLVMPVPLHALPNQALGNGVSVVTAPDVRWHRCDIKSVMLLPNVLAKQRAREQGAFEAVLVRDGMITEGASTNVFVVIDGVLTTHPADHDVLNGISRQVVLELAAQLGLDCQERAFSKESLHAAQEVFLTSTTIEVLPITCVDGRAVGSGRPGPVTMRLHEAFQRLTGSLA